MYPAFVSCFVGRDDYAPASQSIEPMIFFFGGESGKVFFADDMNHCTEVFDLGGPLRSMLFYEQKRSVVIITSSFVLTQFKLGADNRPIPEKKV